MTILNQYQLGDHLLRYHLNDKGQVGLCLIPAGREQDVLDKDWAIEPLVQLHARGDQLPNGYGNGHTLDIKGAGGTWDSGINTTGGVIKNITVTGSFRGIFIKLDEQSAGNDVTFSASDKAKGKILETLMYEYSDGRCVRGWLPLDHHIYSDGPVWVTPTVNAYIKETGDVDFLNHPVKYLDEGEDTVWEHILTAMRFVSDDVGEHGLVHSRDGDWNDSLNMTGLLGKGESVWTSIALCYALKNAAEIAEALLGDNAIRDEMLERRERMIKAINAEAWDGEWYLAAINDYNEKVGSHEESEGKIYLNSQTWAILSEVASGERAEKCIESVDKYLDSDYGPLTLYPTYTKFNNRIGRLTSFIPGIWENGTPYCHGGTFKVVADCLLGRGDKAYETILKIMPNSETNPSTHSGCEPYALTNMYFGPDNPRRGETLFAWVTGTAGWMFRAVVQYMMGFHPEYNGFSIKPCIPAEWGEVTLTRKFRGDTYNVTIKNESGAQSGVKSVTLDGVEVGASIKLVGDGNTHNVVVTM